MRSRTTVGMLVAGLVTSLLVTIGGNPAGAELEGAPEGFELTNVIAGLRRPTNLEFSSTGQVFVAEQGGKIKVFDSIDDSTPTEVVNLRGKVHSVNGRGLLGMALDPDFPNTPHIYVLYTHDAPIGGTAPTYGNATSDDDECPNPPGPGECVVSGRISRLVLDGDVAVSETVLLEDWCQEWTSHSVGDLRFGPDGALFATAGDGAFAGTPDWGQRAGKNGCDDPPIPFGGEQQDSLTSEAGAYRSQDQRTSADPAGLSGTVIRIDKNTGLAWPDNPNASHADPNVARTVAYGLRNPFRTAIRPGTGELWLGDVGWNTWEEIDVVADPTDEVLNFGWPCYEGSDRGYDIPNNICDDLVAEGPGAVQPAYWQYEQTVAIVDETDPCLEKNGSPSALTFYPGGAYPNTYDDAFFMGDYSRRCVWAMFAGPDGRPDPATAHVVMSDVAVSDLEIGPNGDVYILNIFGGGALLGTVVRLSYPSGVAGPTARLSVDDDAGPTPHTVTLDASASTPGSPDDILSFDWDLDGDGTFGDASGAVVTTTYHDEGRFTATVAVTDQNDETDTASQLLVVGTPPTVTITTPVDSLSWEVDDEIAFAGSATDSTGGSIPTEDLEWDLILHHCETLDDCHTHTIGTVSGIDSGSFVAPDHEYPSFIEVALTATSAAGLTTTESVELFPATALLTVDAVPQGIDLSLNAKTVPTPTTLEVIVGSANTLSAPAQQVFDGQLWDFERWSDGGNATHDVFVFDDVTYTAEHIVAPVPTILVEDAVIVESSGTRVRLNLPVRLSAPHDSTVRVRAKLGENTASFGSDFVKWTSKTVWFNPGQTLKTIPIDIQGDRIDELDETFFVNFDNPQNAPLPDTQAEVTIIDDDATPSITVADKRVTEGNGTGTKLTSFQVRLSGRSDRPVSVRVETRDGTATAGVDYEQIPSQFVTIPAGWTSKSVPVRLIRDDLPEGDETFTLQLSDPDNADLGVTSSTFTIRDDEPKIKVNDVRITEGSTGQRSFRFIVSMNRTARQAVTVDYATVDGTAAAPEDFVALSGTLTIPQGARSRVVTVKVNGDRTPEPTETFSLALSNPTGATIVDGEGIGTIRSDDYEPIVTVTDVEKVEASSSAVVRLELDEPATRTISVKVRTVDGSAVAPEDYEAITSRTISFGSGASARNVFVKVKADLIAEGDETFTVELFDPVLLRIGDDSATVTIIDND